MKSPLSYDRNATQSRTPILYIVAQKISHDQESSISHVKTANEATFSLSFEYKVRK